MKTKGFTLMELLVVIAIIALLLAILVPSLSKAKEVAYRTMCCNHFKSFGTANAAYVNATAGQYYCPVTYLTPGNPGNWTTGWDMVQWVANKTFRDILKYDSYPKNKMHAPTTSAAMGAYLSPYNMPKNFICPADKISIDWANQLDGVLMSYAYNLSDWNVPTLWKSTIGQQYVGHKLAAVSRPPDKLAFIDGIDWWTNWRSADYRKAWDKVGQQNNNTYRTGYGVYGATVFRHSEGADIGFYDGHAKYMKKQAIFVIADSEASPSKPGMWVVDDWCFHTLHSNP